MSIEKYTKQGKKCDHNLQIGSMLSKCMQDQDTNGTERNRSKNLLTNFKNQNSKRTPRSGRHGGERQQGHTRQ